MDGILNAQGTMMDALAKVRDLGDGLAERYRSGWEEHKEEFEVRREERREERRSIRSELKQKGKPSGRSWIGTCNGTPNTVGKERPLRNRKIADKRDTLCYTWRGIPFFHGLAEREPVSD